MNFLYIPKFDLTLYVGSIVIITWDFSDIQTQSQLYIPDFVSCTGACSNEWCSLKVKIWCEEETDYKCINNNVSKIEVISRGINKVTEV